MVDIVMRLENRIATPQGEGAGNRVEVGLTREAVREIS
jgi:hypothetical protein